MSVETSRSASRVVVSTWGLFAALLLMMLGNGLLGSIIGLRATIEGFATVVTGYVMAGYYAGFLLGAFTAPKFVERVGHVRVFAALASLASTAALVHIAFVDPTVWFVMRFVTGFSFAGLYIVAESWLATQSTPQSRGRILGTYMVVVMGGAALSQALLTVADVAGFALFVLASILVSLAVVPVSLSAGPTPDFRAPATMGIGAIWRTAPLGIVTGFGTGLSVSAFLGMGTVYGRSAGMGVSRIALFMGLGLAGSVLLQWPIGALSDRLPRRRVLLAVTMTASAAAFWGTITDPAAFSMLVIAFVFGAFSFPLYSLALSHINDQIPAGAAISASVVFVFVNGAGAIFGAPLAANAMESIGIHGYFWALGVIHGLIGIFAAYRIVVQEGLPVATQRAHAMIPARTGAALAIIGRKLLTGNGDNGDDDDRR